MVGQLSTERQDLLLMLKEYNICQANLRRTVGEYLKILNAITCSMKVWEKNVVSSDMLKVFLTMILDELMSSCSERMSVLTKTAGKELIAAPTCFVWMAAFVSPVILQ